MVIISKLLSFFCVFLSLFFMVRCVSCRTEQACRWVMDVLEMTPEAKFRVKDNVISAQGSYFLRIRLSSQNKISPAALISLVYTGYTPYVKLEVIKYGLDEMKTTKTALYTEGVFVQFNHSTSATDLPGNFLILESSSSDLTQQQSNCKLEQTNIQEESDFPMSDVAWLVPVSVNDETEFIRCTITNPDVIAGAIHTVHSNGFTKLLGNIFVVQNATTGSFMQPLVINRLEVPTPFLIVATGNQDCILTHSEFETSFLIKILNVSQGGHSKVCPESCSSDEVTESLSLPDRILITTCFGLQEIRQSEEHYVTNIVLPVCVSKLVAPTQSVPRSVHVLVIGESLVYEARLQQGISLTFSQLKDVENSTICEFLEAQLYQVIPKCTIEDASINSVPNNYYVFIVTAEISATLYQYIIGYKDKNWEALFAIPTSIPKVTQGADDHVDQHWKTVTSTMTGPIPVYVTGLSFTKTDNDVIFIWGNILLYSPNGCQDVFWLADFSPESSNNISIFSSANDGSYAFLTTSREVWWGQSGTGRVQMLEVVGQWNVGHSASYDELRSSCAHDYSILSLFFDTSGQLWKVIKCHNSSQQQPCLQRSKVLVSYLLSHSHLTHEQTSVENTTTTSSSVDQFITALPRHCVHFSISFHSCHDNYYTRHVIKHVNTPYLVNSIPGSSQVLGQYLKNLRASSRDQHTMAVNQSKYELPVYVYLWNNVSFGFEVMMSLESRQDGSNYWSSMDQLRLSYHVTDATFLHVTAIRTAFTHNATVHYQFTIKNSGVVLKKNIPGIGLHPVHLRVQPWKGDEACLATNPEANLLKGRQLLTVLLGCPPGIKVIFDPVVSINMSKKSQFCDAKHGIACFLFENTFHPVFNLLDESTGNVTLFTGNYHLRIKGGGRNLDSITDYSEEDITLFNYKDLGSPSTLIWTPKDKVLGSIPAFNISTNGLQWLCGRKSPCSEISPTFPHSPEFYFKLEFSNRDIQDDTSSCDLTTDFIIRIHGLPLGSLYPATVIVMSSIGIIVCYVFTMYALKRNNQYLWNMMCHFLNEKRDVILNWTRKRLARSTVEPTNQETAVQDHPIHIKKEI